MEAVVKRLVLAYLLFNVCYCSPTTELLETVIALLNHRSRFYSHADRNMAESLIIVLLEVAVDSVHRLDDSLDRGAQANAEKIVPLKFLVTQLQYLVLHRWEMLLVRAVSCTSVHPVRAICISF